MMTWKRAATVVSTAILLALAPALVRAIKPFLTVGVAYQAQDGGSPIGDGGIGTWVDNSTKTLRFDNGTSTSTFTSFSNQSANIVFSGPSSGGAAAPAFRALVTADLPSTAVSASSYGDASHTTPFTVDAKGRLTAAASTAIALADSAITYASETANKVFASPNGSSGAPTYRALVAADLPATAVTPATYGDSTHVGAFTVDQQGRITSASSVAVSGGGGSTGNYTFSTNTMDLSGAATMSIAPTTATAISLGQNTTITGSKTLTTGTGTTTMNGAISIASGVDETAVGGASDFDWSASSGIFKTPTGAATLASSSYSLNATFTTLFGGFSTVDYCKNTSGATCTTAATNATTGLKFRPLVAMTITGVRFFWPGGLGAKTIRVRIYDAAGTSHGTTDVSVNASGIYSGTFTGYVISGSSVNNVYYATMWCTDATNYARSTDPRAYPGYNDTANTASTASYQKNAFIYVDINDMFGTGDVVPSSHTSTQYMLAEPIYTIP